MRFQNIEFVRAICRPQLQRDPGMTEDALRRHVMASLPDDGNFSQVEIDLGISKALGRGRRDVSQV